MANLLSLQQSDPVLWGMMLHSQLSQHEASGAGEGFAAFRPIGSDSTVPIASLERAIVASGGKANWRLIKAVAEKVAETQPNFPNWMDRRFFTDEDLAEYRCMPLYEAVDIAKRNFDAHTPTGANTIIAQLTHTRLADGSLSRDVLRKVMFDNIAEPGTGISREDQDRVDHIMWLSEECARIEQHPYANVDVFQRGKDLLGMLAALHPLESELEWLKDAGREGSDDYKVMASDVDQRKKVYQAEKAIYDNARKYNGEIYVGDESSFLNSEYPDRTLFVRMRNTLDKLQWLLTKISRPAREVGPQTRRYAEKMAEYVDGMYMPTFERFGWSAAHEGLGYLIMEVLDPGAYNRIYQWREGLPRDLAAKAREHIVDLVSKDEERLDLRRRYGITFETSEREKSIYSIWRKVTTWSIEKDVPVAYDHLQDVFGERFIFEKTEVGTEGGKKDAESAEAYEARIDGYEKRASIRVGEIIFALAAQSHGLQAPFVAATGSEKVPGRYVVVKDKDFISEPKENGYESLHLTVDHTEQAPEGQNARTVSLEVQARTRRMDNYARFSDEAFHATYKDLGRLTTTATAAAKQIKMAGSQVLNRVSVKTRDIVRVLANRREMRRRLLTLADRHLSGERATFAEAKAGDYITVRTAGGKSIDLPKWINERAATLFDHVYLIVVALGQDKKHYFENFTGLRINPLGGSDKEAELTPEFLKRGLNNADRIELIAGERHITENAWFRSLRDLWDRGVENPTAYVNIVRAREILKIPAPAVEPGPPVWKRGSKKRAKRQEHGAG